MELKICHLYPDILNLYGDQGNIICMKKRLEWRNIECSVTEVSIGESAKFTDFDIFFIGGGQDFEQEILQAARQMRLRRRLQTARHSSLSAADIRCWAATTRHGTVRCAISSAL